MWNINKIIPNFVLTNSPVRVWSMVSVKNKQTFFSSRVKHISYVDGCLRSWLSFKVTIFQEMHYCTELFRIRPCGFVFLLSGLNHSFPTGTNNLSGSLNHCSVRQRCAQCLSPDTLPWLWQVYDQSVQHSIILAKIKTYKDVFYSCDEWNYVLFACVAGINLAHISALYIIFQ